MRDFSLLYGPARTWLPAIVTVALLVVAVHTTLGSLRPPLPDPDPAAPTAVEAGTVDLGSVVVPAGARPGDPRGTVPVSTSADPDPWAAYTEGGRSGDDVPITSLRPSPESMTDAGRDLVRGAADPDPG